MNKRIFGFLAALLLVLPVLGAGAQQSGGPWSSAAIGGLTYDSTAANIAGGCQVLSGTFPKQTITGAAGVDARTTTSEALADSDRCKLVTFSNGSAVAATIAQAGSGGNFNSTWVARLLNLGAGTVTLTPATSTINGASTLILTTGQGADIYSNGTNYFAQVGSGAGGGSGTVTSIATGACVTGGTITTSGTIAGINSVDARSTTSEAVSNSDQCKTVTFSNGSAIAATIAQAGGGGNFAAGWKATLVDLGAGTTTLTPTTSTVNGASTLVLTTGQSCDLTSDGANYVASCGKAGSGLSATLTNTHIFVGNGSNVATDVALSGDLTVANTGVATAGANVAKINADTQWSGKRVSGATPVVLTDASTVAVDASLGNTFEITLGGNRAMGAPSNTVNGSTLIFYMIQDGTGTRIPTWNAVYKWPGGTAPTLSTGAGKIDLVSCSVRSSNYNCALVGLDFH